MEYSYIRKLLKESKHTVCLLGLDVSMDCGCMNYKQEDGNQDIELKYGYLPEELFSSAYYNTRPQHFFNFYKSEVISSVGEPDACVETLARMEQDGKLAAIVTRELFRLPVRAGCKSVIELHGSVFDNACPHCNKHFPLSFMQEAKGIPLCPDCKIPVRPTVCLVGDMVDSQRMSKATAEVAAADTLLVIGADMNSMLVENFLPYFSGKQIILIHERKSPYDRLADFVYHAKPCEVLPLIWPKDGKEPVTPAS